jgi:predicted RNase H-like nuclease
MSVVLGADGVSRNRWVVAQWDGADVTWHLVTGAAAVLALADDVGAEAIALDVPIGLPVSGRRLCDELAYARLGARRSSVFMTPPRHVLEHLSYGEARATFPSLTAQAYALLSRVRDVDAVLRATGPEVHQRVVECHPEVVFHRLTGDDLARKRSAAGVFARLRALADVRLTGVERAPDEAALDDALDALACAWTASRWLRGAAEVLGGGLDELGLPMRIVL